MKALHVAVSLAALAGLALAGGDVFEEVKEVKPEKTPKAVPADPKEVTSFTDNMEDLAGQLSLTEEQKKKIQEIRDARDKAIERWNKANEKKIAAVEAKMTAEPPKGQNPKTAEGVRKQAEAYLNTLYQARNVLAAGYERKMFALLTPEQRGKYNGPILNEAVAQEFAGLTALTDDQNKKVLELCEAQGKLLPGPVEAESLEKLTLPIKQRVFQKILTAPQRKEYTEARKAAAKTTKTPTKRGG